MKIGLLVGLMLAGGIMVYVCTRPSLSPRARILRQREGEQQSARPRDVQPAPAVGETTAQASLTEKVEKESPGAGADSTTAETRVERQEQSSGRITAERQQTKEIPADKRYVAKDYKTRKFYIVRKGDTLSKISKKYYGSGNKWYRIYEANRDVLDNPDKLKPGMKLYIPD